MKRSTFLQAASLFTAAAIVQYPATVQACAVCMGADSHTGEALNGAIFLMLGFLGLIFSGIAAVVVSFIRRARTPLPPHTQFTQPFPQTSTDPLS